jgi:5-methylthioadenosine/S-adenosylhomocysteine deaminase
MTIFRGLADDLPLDTWLNQYIFPAEATFINPENVALGTQLACAEMLLSGTTCFCDGYFLEDRVAREVFKTGMRAVLGQGVIDFPAPGVPEPRENVSAATGFVEKWRDASALIQPAIFCHSAYTCSAATLSAAKSAARDQGVLFQIHAAETRHEAGMIQSGQGQSPVRFLDRHGILDANTLLVHAVWVDDDDIAIIKASGAAVSHNPESNMKLASGIAPVPSYLAAGIPTGLGTDGCASNNDLDLFAEMDMTAKLHKVALLDPSTAGAHIVLKMATIEGARAIGLDAQIGSLEPGKQADLIVVETRNPHLVPLYNPVSQVVYAVHGSDVKDVMVAGKMLVRDRSLATLDWEDILKRVNALQAEIAKFSNRSK